MALSVETIQKAYIAFFNRPADVGGLAYWLAVSEDERDLLAHFGNSDEYTLQFSGRTNREIVEILYQNLLARQPDAGGWDYWTYLLDHGIETVATLAYTILNTAASAEGRDTIAVDNKVAAAKFFTESLAGTDGEAAYAAAGSEPSEIGRVKSWLATVNETFDSLAYAQMTLLTSDHLFVTRSVGDLVDSVLGGIQDSELYQYLGEEIPPILLADILPLEDIVFLSGLEIPDSLSYAQISNIQVATSGTAGSKIHDVHFVLSGLEGGEVYEFQITSNGPADSGVYDVRITSNDAGGFGTYEYQVDMDEIAEYYLALWDSGFDLLL
jgi:hypothetical protein